MFPKPLSNTTDTFTPSEIAFLYVFRSLWSNLKNLSKCLKSRILTNLSDVVQLLSLYDQFVKCSIFKSLYSFVHSQIAYKIKYFLIVQSLSPCAFLCCMSAMVASRWHCHHYIINFIDITPPLFVRIC